MRRAARRLLNPSRPWTANILRCFWLGARWTARPMIRNLRRCHLLRSWVTPRHLQQRRESRRRERIHLRLRPRRSKHHRRDPLLPSDACRDCSGEHNRIPPPRCTALRSRPSLLHKSMGSPAVTTQTQTRPRSNFILRENHQPRVLPTPARGTPHPHLDPPSSTSRWARQLSPRMLLPGTRLLGADTTTSLQSVWVFGIVSASTR